MTDGVTSLVCTPARAKSSESSGEEQSKKDEGKKEEGGFFSKLKNMFS